MSWVRKSDSESTLGVPSRSNGRCINHKSSRFGHWKRKIMIKRSAFFIICLLKFGRTCCLFDFLWFFIGLVFSTFTTGHCYHLGRGKIESVNVVDGHYRRMSVLLLNSCTSPQLLYFSWTLAWLCHAVARCNLGVRGGKILNWRWTTHSDYWLSSLFLHSTPCFSISLEGATCRQNDKYLFKCGQSLQPALSIAVASLETIPLCSTLDSSSVQGMKFLHASTNFVETRDSSSSLPPSVRVCTLSFVALYFFLSPGLTHNQEDVSIPELCWERCVWCRRRGLRIRTLFEVCCDWIAIKHCKNSKKRVVTQSGCYKWRRWVPAL